MAMFLYVLIFLIIPIVAFSLFKRLVVGYLVASFLGAALVIVRMVYLEAHAPDGDFDFIFCVSVIVWGVIAFVLYLPYILAARFIKNRLKCKP
jgi:hypothetical protein